MPHAPAAAAAAQLSGVGECILLLVGVCVTGAGWLWWRRLMDSRCCLREMAPAEFGYFKEDGDLCKEILCIKVLYYV